MCLAEGRFPDPAACEGYVECVAELEGSSRLAAHYYRCPSGFFHPALGRCVAQAQVSHVFSSSRLSMPLTPHPQLLEWAA